MADYNMSRKKLKEILLGHKNFCGQQLRAMLENGIPPNEITYKVSEMLTDAYIDQITERCELVDR